VTFLLRLQAVTEDGDELADETIVVTDDVFYGFEKGMTVLGQSAKLIVTFDPPLAPTEAF